MTTREMSAKLNDLHRILANSQPLFAILEATSKRFADLLVAFGAVANNSSETGRGTMASFEKSVHDIFKAARAEVEKWDIGEIYEAVYRIRSAVESFGTSHDTESTEQRNQIAKQLKFFTDAYGTYVKTPERSNLVMVLLCCDRALRSLHALSWALSATTNLAGSEPQLAKGEDTFSIFLPGEITVEHMAGKLDALARLYQEVCEFYEISTGQFPLRALKIESGSLWVWGAGSAGALKILSELLRRAADFFERNYTLEGKLKEARLKQEVVTEFLQLHIQMEQAGLESSERKHLLDKASVKITEDLAVVLSGADSIEINGKGVALTPVGKQKLLDSKKRLALPEVTRAE